MLIPLTRGQFAIIDDEDFPLLGDRPWHAYWNKDSKTFYAKQSYRDSNGKNKARLMHRIIMDSPSLPIEIDHKNHNGLDNRKENLRLATRSQNVANSRSTSGLSQFRGVSLTRNRNLWRAKICTNNRETCLGHYLTEIEAAQAYNNEARIRFGEFATLNEVPDGSPKKVVIYDPSTNGTSFNKQCKKWCGYVRVNGKHKHLGLFATQVEALAAVSKFKQEIQDEHSGSPASGVGQPSASTELV